MVGVAAGLAVLRSVCVPVSSFRAALEQVHIGMSADSVKARLGLPNQVCILPDLAHLVTGSENRDPAELTARTRERWVYTERRPRPPIPRVDTPGCRAPAGATELGFDDRGRLLWMAREAGRTPLEATPNEP